MKDKDKLKFNEDEIKRIYTIYGNYSIIPILESEMNKGYELYNSMEGLPSIENNKFKEMFLEGL